MKKFSKILSVALLVALVLSLGVASAFADPAPAYSITVTNDHTDVMSINGKTYKAYKVFDLTLGDPVANPAANQAPYDGYAYSIKNTDWAWDTLTTGATTNSETGVITTTYGIKLTPSAADPTVYVVDGQTMTETNARSLADALKPALPNTPDGSKEAANESATIELDEPGYYAVYGVVVPTDPYADPAEEVVAALSLTTTDPNGAVKPKATVPPLDKKITGQHKLDEAGKAATAEVGTTVSFELDSKVPDLTGYTDYTYTIHDTMTNGLTFTTPSDIKVLVNSVDKTTDCQVKVDGQTFTVTVPFGVLSAGGKDNPIVVTYSAVVNANALTTNYEKNTAYLEYSHSPYDDNTNRTPDSEVYVIDLNIDVDKVANEQGGKKLDGATFVLFKGATQPADTEEAWYKYDNGKATWVTKENADTFVTNNEGKINPQVRGLEAEATGSKYGLLETVAPTGYNLLDTPIIVTLTGVYAEGTDGAKTVTITAENAAMSDGTVTVSAAQQSKQPVATATIINNSGTRLPSTGGIGTTIFYVVGGVLVLAAIILLVTKKRMSE